jgi:hypothetical protein
MCQNAVLEVLSQKDGSRNGILDIYPGIGITSTTPLTKLWVTSCVLELFFLRKKALCKTEYIYNCRIKGGILLNSLRCLSTGLEPGAVARNCNSSY